MEFTCCVPSCAASSGDQQYVASRRLSFQLCLSVTAGNRIGSRSLFVIWLFVVIITFCCIAPVESTSCLKGSWSANSKDAPLVSSVDAVTHDVLAVQVINSVAQTEDPVIQVDIYARSPSLSAKVQLHHASDNGEDEDVQGKSLYSKQTLNQVSWTDIAAEDQTYFIKLTCLRFQPPCVVQYQYCVTNEADLGHKPADDENPYFADPKVVRAAGLDLRDGALDSPNAVVNAPVGNLRGNAPLESLGVEREGRGDEADPALYTAIALSIVASTVLIGFAVFGVFIALYLTRKPKVVPSRLVPVNQIETETEPKESPHSKAYMVSPKKQVS